MRSLCYKRPFGVKSDSISVFPEIQDFETSIFTGKYITPLIENYLEDLENSRKDELKMQREKSKIG